MSDDNSIGAFSEDQASRLTGVSKRQLAHWDNTDFFRPSYSKAERGVPFARVYSFRDLVELRVLDQLRNVYGVRMSHLKDVADKLAVLEGKSWASQTLWVVNRQVVWTNPEIGKRESILHGQQVFDIALRVVASGVHKALRELNTRGPDRVGKIVRSRYVLENQPVFAGTRIPVSLVKSFILSGYTPREVLAQYPSLQKADITAALMYGNLLAA